MSSFSLPTPPLLLFLLLLYSCNLPQQQPVSAELILEQGYTVSTVLDGNKLPDPIIPAHVFPRLSGTHDLVVLDSTNSLFYTLSLPISQDSTINRFSGNGTAGFADGDLVSAMFNRPRSFAIDLKGNVYVADKTNHAIRKINKSGVTTIAGGHSGKPGKVDGPAQDASFSDDFELAFVPDICALLITDRGNKLIRQMNLKPDDCGSGSGSRLQMGLASSAILGVSCLFLGLAVGSVISYGYLKFRESTSKPLFCGTWKRFQIHLERRILIVCSDIRNAIANSSVYKKAVASSRGYQLMDRLVKMSLSHLSLTFSIFKLGRNRPRQPTTLFGSDGASNYETKKSQIFADQLEDLISFDEDVSASGGTKETIKQGDYNESSDSIDDMIHANILDFTQQARQRSVTDGPPGGNSGLVRRR